MSDERQHSRADCLEIFSRLSEYLDGELEPGPCSEIDSHMGDCQPCQAFLDSLRTTVRLVQDLEAPPLPGEVRDQIREAYRRLRESEKI